MDSLIVDLDKVLDDFEAEETTNKNVKHVSSEYANFLAKHDDSSWEEASSAPADSVNNLKAYNKDDLLSYIDYGEPYEPVGSNFDLSEADFAPSVKTKPELALSNGMTNGHDESLRNEQFNFDHRRPGKLPHTNDAAINGFKENESDDPPMHNGNKDHMIDLQNTSVTKAEFVGKSSQFNEEKLPIQVVDIFTPVSENAPQIPSATAYLQSLITVKQNENEKNLHENINVKFNEGVPEYNIDEEGVVSQSSNTKVSNSDNVIDGNNQTESSTTSRSSTNTNCDPFIKNDLSHGNDSSCLKKVNNLPSTEVQSDHSNGLINQSPPNIAHRGDSKKADEGYDSYDCLSKDIVIDGLQVKREDNSVTPSLNLSDVISERHSSNNESTQVLPKTELLGSFDQIDSSNNESTQALPKTEQPESFDQTVLKTIDCESNAIVSDSTKDTVTATVNHAVVGFGQELQVNDEDMDDYLRDIEGPSNSLDVSVSNSLSVDSDANMYPPSYTNIDQLSNVEENHGPKCDEMGASDFDDYSQTLNDGSPSSKIDTSQNEQLPNQAISLNEYAVNKDQNCEQVQPSASNVSPVESLTVQNMQLPSVERGGARPKDTNWHASKQGLSVISNELPKDLEENKQLVELDEEQRNINSETSNIEINNFVSISSNEEIENLQNEAGDNSESPVMRRFVPSDSPNDMSRPHSWGPSGSDTVPIPQQKRPNSLNLPQRGDINGTGERSQQPYTFPYPAEDEEETISPEVREETIQSEEAQAVGGEPEDEASGASGHTPSPDPSSPEPHPDVETALGKSAPMWIPDSVAPVCMSCEAKFTFTKRRHHCRACGKVFCSSCCNLKSRLSYMENKEARVCIECHRQLTIAELSSSGSPNPNNPSEYCSVIPPSQQASARSQPPSVLVPASVLKREGSNRHSSEGKHVMFSDGIRPGGDLTELDGSDSATRLPIRRSGRSQKKVEKSGSPETAHRQVARKLRASEARRHICLIPETGLPPVIKPTGDKGGYVMEESQEFDKVMSQIKDDEAEPVIFALNANLFVLVKIINLDCCVNRICWCFTTRGMCNVGQDEIVFVLEVIPDEENIPLDIMRHFYTVYEEAGKGNTVTHMGHTIFNQTFLDSRDHGGILYIRPTFQCLHKLLLPNPPYVFGILLQKWETPWAKVFPLRLLLRLGAEYRYYPCPLISVRNRKPVFFEIGHTIMNLLADFRNFQYMLPQIKGVTIHMEDKKTAITFPRNRYEDIMKVVSNSNEHVMALGASFSLQADSHLVCIQNDDGNYQTQAINIQNKPRKVTGASFVVFNGALKTSSGLKAKSSIVEDGLMVQITPESMVALKQALKDMTDFTIECGSQTAPDPDEVVSLMWGDDDKNINIGVKSPIDDMSMDGVESIHIPNATDYVGEKQIIRWTDVFFIQNKDSGSTRWEPVDLSRLAETLSNATCIALTPHLDKLKEASLIKIGLRVNIEIEKVGYEIGSNGERLPDLYMNDLDNELIPVIHSAASQNRGGAIILELIFHVLD